MARGHPAIGCRHSAKSVRLCLCAIHGYVEYLVGDHQSATDLPTRWRSHRSACDRHLSTHRRPDGGACSECGRRNSARILVHHKRHGAQCAVPRIHGDEQHSDDSGRLWTSKLVNAKKISNYFSTAARSFFHCKHADANDIIAYVFFAGVRVD